VGRHCYIEQVEAVFDRGEARLRHWNRLAGLSPGRQYKHVKPANVTKPAMERVDRAEGIVDGHKRKAIGHSNMRGYSGIRVAKSRTGAA
jgi:hypothetical protein